MRRRTLGMLAGLFVVARCTCSGSDVGGNRFACATDADCAAGFSCVQGFCATGGAMDGGAEDAGSDAGIDAGVDGGADSGTDAGTDAGSGTYTFVQAAALGSYTKPVATSLQVTLSSPSESGDLLIVEVGWGGLDAGVAPMGGVTDFLGNQYSVAAGPFASVSPFQEELFYAVNRGTGANAVTVTMTQSAYDFLEVRVFEYAGFTASPLDGSSGATGPGCLFPLDAGAGFTARPVLNEGGSLAEDELAAPAGAYQSSLDCDGGLTMVSGPALTRAAPEMVFGLGQADLAANWVMLQATFKVAP